MARGRDLYNRPAVAQTTDIFILDTISVCMIVAGHPSSPAATALGGHIVITPTLVRGNESYQLSLCKPGADSGGRVCEDANEGARGEDRDWR